MKSCLLIAFICFSHLSAESDDDCGDIDPKFYLEPRVELDGHLWRPILMQHHPECKCFNQL